VKTLQKHEDVLQLLSGVVVAMLVGWRLHVHGWRWFEWLPAAGLGFFGVGLFWVVVWFLFRKFTYQGMAARNKADLQAGGDGWPSHRESGFGNRDS